MLKEGDRVLQTKENTNAMAGHDATRENPHLIPEYERGLRERYPEPWKKWERIDCDYPGRTPYTADWMIHRLRVPGGWLVKVFDVDCLVYVPDPPMLVVESKA